MPMPLVEALKVVHAVRTNRQVVLPTMGAAREWMALGTHPLDFAYAPSAMGEAPLVGLGIALARPDLQVIVGNGDGCMLMNLGCLVTITAAAPPNFVLVVFDNGVYEVTGQQWTAAAGAARQTARSKPAPVDYAKMAIGCGFSAVYTFDTLATWQAGIREVLAARGPTFVWLKVDPVPGGAVPKPTGPAPQRASEFAQALQSSTRT